MDIPIDRDSPIVVGHGFFRTIGAIFNTPERLFSTFDGFCHQTFRAARSDFMRNAKSDSDDEEEYQIKRNKFRAPIYGPNPAPYLTRTMGIHNDERPDLTIQAQDMKPWKRYCFHKFTTSSCCGKDVTKMQSLEIDDMLRIRVREAESDEEIFTSVAWIRAFNINEPIYAELCHEFYSTYEFDEVCADDELQTKKIIKFRLGGRGHNLTLLEFARRLGLYQAVELEEDSFNVYFEGCLHNDDNLNARIIGDYEMDEEEKSLSAPVYCRDLDTTTLRDLIDSDGKLIPEDPQPGVPRVGIPRPLRAYMQDLYDRMGRMEIRQEAIERDLQPTGLSTILHAPPQYQKAATTGLYVSEDTLNPTHVRGFWGASWKRGKKGLKLGHDIGAYLSLLSPYTCDSYG
ncbi:hypothetical protein Tco_0717447 [Tanacetum coccineum]